MTERPSPRPDESPRQPSSHTYSRPSAITALWGRFSPPMPSRLTVPRMLGLTKSLDVRVLDICEIGCNLFVGEEIAKGTKVRLSIEFKQLGDRLDLDGTVLRATPPPPVAKEWAVRLEFADLTPEQQRTIAGWRSHLTSEQVRKREENREQERRRDLGLK